MQHFLASSQYINWQHPEVLFVAQRLAEDMADQEQVARACFEFVRDEIKHSWDYQENPVTCSASDVLQHGQVTVMQKVSCLRHCYGPMVLRQASVISD